MRRLAPLLPLLAACASPDLPNAPSAALPSAAAPAPLGWEDGSAERRLWSETLRAALRPHLATFAKAADGAAFCPAWEGLAPEDRLEVVATLAVGVSRYESGHNPAAVAGKRRKVQWVGLFQLATDGVFARCAAAEGGSLTDPLLNIRCAVPAMAELVAEDGRLAGGDAGPAGLARWWTVLRPGRRGTLAGIRAETAALPVCAG